MEVIACYRLLGVVVLWYMLVMLFTRCGRLMVHAGDVVYSVWSSYGTCC